MRQIPIRPQFPTPGAPARTAPGQAPPWRLAWLFAAPHRLAFAAAAAVLGASAAWWALAMLARWAPAGSGRGTCRRPTRTAC